MQISEIRKKISNKFNYDLLWLIISFSLITCFGLSINIIIYRVYGSDILGGFNQIYSTYLILSQLSVGGVHLAVQKFIPQYNNFKEKGVSILMLSILLTILYSTLLLVIIYPFNELLGKILDSEYIVQSFKYIIWGLFFFSINKVLLSYLNGKRMIKPFAIFNSLRFIFIFLFIIYLIAFKYNDKYLVLSFALAELCLSLGLVYFLYPHIKTFEWKIDRELINSLRIFGKQAFIGNLLLDINSKIDILVLGVFCTDKLVGVYSFAIFFVDGLMQLPILLRNNINPVITRCYYEKNIGVLNKILKSTIKNTYSYLSPFILLSVLLMPILLLITGMHDKFLILSIYTILSLGLAASIGYQPLLMIFNQLNNPKIHTLFIFFISIVNLLLCFLLIPFWGVYGAAIATALSYVFQVVIQRKLANKHFNLKI